MGGVVSFLPAVGWFEVVHIGVFNKNSLVYMGLIWISDHWQLEPQPVPLPRDVLIYLGSYSGETDEQ